VCAAITIITQQSQVTLVLLQNSTNSPGNAWFDFQNPYRNFTAKI